MKTRYLTLASLLIIGIFGASDPIAAATIHESISSKHIADIAPIAEISDESLIAIGNIIDHDIHADLIGAEIIEIAG